MTLPATQTIRIGHSPDPDDAFMFYAVTQGRLPLMGFRVEHCLEDIESLNQRALRAELEVTAISLHAYAHCHRQYRLLTSGTSMGDGYGPLVVAVRPMDLADLRRQPVAIPGQLTTAALVLQLWAGDVPTTILPFDQILEAVRQGRVAAGILIHEGQLTFGGHGLTKLVDLGQWWKTETGLPLPLGVNGVRRDLPDAQQRAISRLMQESIGYALGHRHEALAYAQRFGRGLDVARTDQFVGMYVNHWTEDCGAEGRRAMNLLLERAAQIGAIPEACIPEFVE